MGFSTKKEQDLDPNGFKSPRARHHSGSNPPQNFEGTKFSLQPFKSSPVKSCMPKNARYTHLLGDPEIKRWHANVARGSRITADVYLRRLGAFCSSHSLLFRDLLQMEERDLKNLLLDFITEMEKRGYAGSYITESSRFPTLLQNLWWLPSNVTASHSSVHPVSSCHSQDTEDQMVIYVSHVTPKTMRKTFDNDTLFD